MSQYYGVIGNRDYIKWGGERRPFWEFLDRQPDGWLTSLAYWRKDLPTGRTMIFDCGAWSYKDEETPKLGKNLVTPEWTFERYTEFAKSGDFIIAPDHMLIPGVDLDARRAFNIQSAQRFLQIAAGAGYRPMATVHGMDLEERLDQAHAYAAMGYRALALGGLAARASQKSLVLGMVRELRLVVPDVWLHVLGLSSPEYAAAWDEYGVNSFDGSSHFKQAFTAGAFYTLRNDGTLQKHDACRPGEPVTAPLCHCKACTMLREDDIDTRSYGSNEHNMGRAAHNMNMLMQAQRATTDGITVLVSCVGEKLSYAAKAADLYQSDWFIKARVYAETFGQQWYILSAKHGLLSPETEIEPYEMTLNTMGRDERRAWAEKVFAALPRAGHFVILAGEHYREFLLPMTQEAGMSVSVPMVGLGIGQQLAWLKEQANAQMMLW